MAKRNVPAGSQPHPSCKNICLTAHKQPMSDNKSKIAQLTSEIQNSVKKISAKEQKLNKAKLTLLDKQSTLDYLKKQNRKDKSSDKSDNKYGEIEVSSDDDKPASKQGTSMDYTEETKLETSTEQVEEVTDLKHPPHSHS